MPWYWAAERATPGFLDVFSHRRALEALRRAGVDRRSVRRRACASHADGSCSTGSLRRSLVGRRARRDRAKAASRDATPLSRVLPPIRGASTSLWAVTPMVFFTPARNILITYVLPGLPAFALLARRDVVGPHAASAAESLKPALVAARGRNGARGGRSVSGRLRRRPRPACTERSTRSARRRRSFALIRRSARS